MFTYLMRLVYAVGLPLLVAWGTWVFGVHPVIAAVLGPAHLSQILAQVMS